VLLHYLGTQELGNWIVFSRKCCILFCQQTEKKTEKYHLVTAKPPFTVKMIDCVHQTGPRKGAQHPTVCYPHAWCLPSLSLCRLLVKDGSCSSSSVERKANGQYCWDILISQQMLDDIKMILVTISVFQQDSALVHLAFNTAQLPQCKTQLPFSWATDDIILILQQNRLRWYRHVLRKEDTDRLKKCMEYEVEGSRPRGRPENMERGCAKILPST